MTDVIPIDKDQKVVQLFGRIQAYTERADAGADLVRDLARDAEQNPDSQHCLHKLQCVCDALLMATSFLMSDLDELYGVLAIDNPNWSEIYDNFPDGAAIREKLEGGAS